MAVIRKEQGVFLGTVALLGWLVAGDAGRTEMRDSTRGGAATELPRFPAPDTELALPEAGRGRELGRDLFSPPRDTLPLPPLELEPPPLEPLAALAPPAPLAPAPRAMGALLARRPDVTPVEGLFEGGYDGEEPDGAPVIGGGAGNPQVPSDAIDRLDSFRRLYDWIQVPGYVFGHIRNAERFGLEDRPGEAIRFVEVDPESGAERFQGQVIEYGRERVEAFGFADTPANRLEIARREFEGPVRPAQLDALLSFAEECIALRHEAPRALEIAESIYDKAEEVAEGDPRPRLGLARCHEAAFDFERAYGIYRELLTGTTTAQSVVVQARLADLLARFRLFERAEAEYRAALAKSNTNWEANWRYGRFLLERGRGAEALPRLEMAQDHEPSGLGRKAERSRIRGDLGWALLQVGDLEQARGAFARALGNDPSWPPAIAGALATEVFAGRDASAFEAQALEGGQRADFDLLVVLGLAALEGERWEEAKDRLELAAELDPFRRYEAARALSWLAERTANAQEAWRQIELAHENDPTDPYTLYQRGRLAAVAEDLETAEASFRGALDRELDFAPALVMLAVLAQERGRHEDAERYYERALALDPGAADVHTRRGFNLLQQGASARAAGAFRRALELDAAHASARCGLAWCEYLAGDSRGAQTMLSELADARRGAGEADPHRRWAEAQIARIVDHEQKEVWLERFDRSGAAIGNEWRVEEPSGIRVDLREGTVHFSGQVSAGGRARLLRELNASDFVSYQARLRVLSGTRTRVGFFVALERERATDTAVTAGASLSRNGSDGVLQARIVRAGEEPQYQDLPGNEWPLDQTVELRIERQGEAGDTQLTLYFDGVPVLDGVKMGALGRSSAALRLGVFVEGDLGQGAEVAVEEVELVRRVRR